MTAAATIVFPTRNRKDNLLAAIAGAITQTVPVDIIVMDDGSTDETREAVQERFPQVAYHCLATDRGPTFQRNRGVELAATPIVFPLDDDAVLVSPHTVEQTLAEFNHPRIGAVGIPYKNVRVDQQIRQNAPDDSIWVEHTFTGASHAVRREAFLAVNGYREDYFYMGEEGDLTLRMLAAGWVTRLGRADFIEHYESPNRDTARADFYGRRNDVLFALKNVPTSYLPGHLVGTVLNGVRSAVRSQHPLRQLYGLTSGLWEGVCNVGKGRYPVSREIYRLQRRLKKVGPHRFVEIERCLPPLRSPEL